MLLGEKTSLNVEQDFMINADLDKSLMSAIKGKIYEESYQMAVHPSARRPKTSLAGFKKAATTAKAKKPGFQVTHGGKTMGFHKAQLTSDAKAKLQSAAKKDAMLAADAAKRAMASKKWADTKLVGAGAAVTSWHAKQLAASKKRAAEAAKRREAQRQSAKQFISGTVSALSMPKSTTTRRYYKKTTTTTTSSAYPKKKKTPSGTYSG